MKYCANYYRSTLGEAGVRRCDPDELKIKYTHNTKEILDFAADEKWDGIKLLLDFFEYEDDFGEIEEYIYAAAKKHNGGCALVITAEQEGIREFAKEKEIDFFYSYPCDSWELFKDVVELGVSDVYITDRLAFDIVAVSAYAKEHNVSIRVYPNMAQSNSILESNLSSFFIRPEDVQVYEPFVDTFEFVCPLDRQPVLFKIYKQGFWKGKLSDIVSIDVNIYNESILPDFAANRIDCQKTCVRVEKGRYRCRHCSLIQSLAETMTKNGLTVSE